LPIFIESSARSCPHCLIGLRPDVV
jgi:hypothetical protein